MRVAFVGHSYHRLTHSAHFLIELLRSANEVTVRWSNNQLNADPEELKQIEQFDCVVIFQVDQILMALLERHNNVLFIPMLDQMSRSNQVYRFLDRPNLKVVCFSEASYEMLRHCTRCIRYFKYYPNPADLRPVHDYHAPRGYFWKRQRSLDEGLVSTLSSLTFFDIFTLHAAPDPGTNECGFQEAKIRARVIRTTQWDSSRTNHIRELSDHNVFFASRCREGIGMAFLEAMAMGFCVVAPDTPTHNEYIRHESTGILYDYRDPRPLNLTGFAEIGQRARLAAQAGYDEWSRRSTDLLHFLAEQ